VEDNSVVNLSEIKTVKASKEDIEAIFSFNEELIKQYENTAEIDHNRVMGWVRRKIENFIDDYQVIKYNDEKVGYYYFHKNKKKMELDDFYIFLKYRNQGIGSYILNKCIKDSNLTIFLYVFIKNTQAISFYEKHGFVMIEAINETRCIMQRENTQHKSGSIIKNLFKK